MLFTIYPLLVRLVSELSDTMVLLTNEGRGAHGSPLALVPLWERRLVMPCVPLFAVSSRLMQLYTMPSLMSRYISARRNTVGRSGFLPLCDFSAVRNAVGLDRTLRKLWELYSTFVSFVNMNAA